jgi:hypothetical protein
MNTFAPILNPFTEVVFTRAFVSTATTPTPAANDREMMVDTLAVAATILAPIPQPGFCFAVTDEATNASVNNIIVSGNGTLIEGMPTFTISENDQSVVFVWDEVKVQWRTAVFARLIDEHAIEFDDDLIVPAGPPGADGSAVLFWGNERVGVTNLTRFLSPGFDREGLAQSVEVQLTAPRSGTLKNMYVNVRAPIPGVTVLTYTLEVNGVGTALAVAVPKSASSGQDVFDQVVVAAGDLLSIRVDKAAFIGFGYKGVHVTCEFTA